MTLSSINNIHPLTPARGSAVHTKVQQQTKKAFQRFCENLAALRVVSPEPNQKNLKKYIDKYRLI